jgi:hypothetical protein
MRLNSNLMNRKERLTFRDSQPAPSINRSSHSEIMYDPTLNARGQQCIVASSGNNSDKDRH